MNDSQFRESIRNQVNTLAGFQVLDGNDWIETSDTLRNRLPSTAGCIGLYYHLFSTGEHEGYWSVWELDKDFRVSGKQGWIQTSVQVKHQYAQEDLDQLIHEIFRINGQYLSSALSEIIVGFELTTQETSCP